METKTYNFRHGRSAIPVLVVHSNGATSNQVRQALKTIGFGSIVAAPSHVAGLDRIQGRDFGIVLFEARPTDIPVTEFVAQALSYDDRQVLIPISAEPHVDDVFGLLQAGSRGFLVLPFTVEAVEEVIVEAGEGPPFNDAVLKAPDRNMALVGVVLNNLYKLAVLQRQAREFPTAAKELGKQQSTLIESMELARLFCEGGEETLVDKIMEGCIQRANTSASRLGRTRKRLQRARQAVAETEE